MGIRIEVFDSWGNTLASAQGEGCAQVVFDRIYQPGDRILIRTEPGAHLRVSLDPGAGEALLYLPEGKFEYAVPFGEPRLAYAPGAFEVTRHLIHASPALPFERTACRDLARNPLDLPEGTGAFPHVRANAETRGESVFAARNVVNGCRANHGHGEWPFLSWGVDIAIDAKITVEFGRPVDISAMGICIRADFPHDSWWTQATLTLSDGTSQVFSMTRTDALQYLDIGRHTVTWARIENWRKFEEPAQFPALVSWEIYGTETATR